ncbi:MAG: hypothetical protein GVY08_09200 [Bacteroidetes bacterium]|jgi:hypothetical protein|nr:hypothetical protein [Bacteroidota bacterium]
MKKIGRISAVGIALTLLLLSPVLLHLDAAAQDLELNATLSETKVFTGEQFTISIEVQSSGSHSMQLPELPVIDGARIISSNPSRSTSISIINGRTTRTTSYIYTLIATETGNYQIPPIPVRIDNKTLQTNSVEFEVVEQGNLSDSNSSYPDIFIQVELDDETPFTGQQVIASIVLYFKQGIEVTSFQPSFGWRTDGFWKEELENISQPRAESTILDGVRYRKATLLRYALFPSRSGDMTLSAYGLSVGMRTRPDRNDPFGSFFGSGTNQRRVNLESDPLELTIASLPDQRESVDINAVGDFEISREISQMEIETGETVELKTTVTGAGNIPLLRHPEYDLPSVLETFTPRETSNVERRGLTIQGQKTFTQQLVTRTPGRLQIPSERVAVFNPETEQYSYVRLPEHTINVSSAPVTAASSSSGGRALTPVTGLAVWYSAATPAIYQQAWFWAFLVLPLLALIAGWWRKTYIDRLKGDHEFRRAELAEQTADERLKQAREDLRTDHEPKQVYNLVHKALTGYISDKTGLPEAGLSDNDLLTTVEHHSVNRQTLKSLKYLLDKCNTISFAPAGSDDAISSDIEKAETLINELKRVL